MKIEILYFEGCPNHHPAVERVQQILREEGISADVVEVNVTDSRIAHDIGFLGSPTVRVNGLDAEPNATAARECGMMCRTYAAGGGREGVPSREMLRTAILAASSGVIGK
jgi:hypothetical protein